MSVYVDIGAKRIQAYLARTPRLKARRGASALLEHELLRASTEPAWRQSAGVNDEGKRTDGVLSLVFDDPAIPDPDVDAVIAETAVRLNWVAPGAEWEIRISRVDTYRDASTAAAAAEASGQTLLAGGAYRVVPVLPAPAEVPVVRFCQTCGVDPAVRRKALAADEDPVALCADCTRRLFEGGARTDDRNWTAEDEQRWARRIKPGGLRAERDLIEMVGALTGTVYEVAEEFQQLAELGSGDANYLCTVFVDGNRFGDFFTALKHTGISVNKLSTALAAAVGEAVAEATAFVLRDLDTALPVVPHLIGGDDLLATVTADRAWDFAIRFLEGYHERTQRLAADYGRRAEMTLTPPTASAGLVFAHASFPFASAVDLADQALQRAKVSHRAEAPALCWVDVTEDGPVLPPHRAAPSLAALQGQRGDIDLLLTVPPSGQAALARVLDDPAQTLAQAYRLGFSKALRPFEAPGSELSIADVLVLGRWWKCRRPA